MDKKKYETLNYALSKKSVLCISAYYILLILVGTVISTLIIVNIDGFVAKDILLYTNIGSISVACMLCSIQYLKRIYKACIDERIYTEQNSNGLKEIGNILYFALRPVYATVFMIIAEFIFLAGVFIVTSPDFEINKRFLYLCVIMSSFIGFSIGRILDGFESFSSKKVQSFFKELEKKNGIE